ncbi:histidine phosphotransferase family protein [Sphingomonas carotinifaciens]|uniref:Histidine phosphotransferase n=1 Tax=Sphingomonas carotinifaciens TaxID=1166323 RepID=A0A1G7IN81_9SPHN|nr:histidine phosphotransferase family protein [Sphingomonas carotinifaciens]MBB4084802.1 histidine phosphotransferase ChpT [Sphingomonas carotinifaciens]MWC44189.1 histidine phosphotransferase [Sphingomonas carotinifaciens]SDF14200.1 histidine phosphotransferase ChpT [Sphingomonas carotinifaciens]
MTVSPVDFASLLCSRLCHDLLSPVGALNNGLELLADETDPAMRARCMDLLAESARASANKLKFFRLAFGAAGGFGDMVDMREARAAIEGLLADNRRTTLGWVVEEPQLPKPAVKILLNLALIGVEALVRGGRIDVGAEVHDTAIEIVVKIEGARIVLDPDLRRTLMQGEGSGEVTSRGAAAFLVHTLATEASGQVLVSEPAEGVMILGAAMRAV